MIEDSRSRDVIQSVLDGYSPEVWVSDRYSSQQNIGENHQICLAHFAREMEKVTDKALKRWLKSWRRRDFAFEKSMQQMTEKEIRKKKGNLVNRMEVIVKLPTVCNVSKVVQTAFVNAHKDNQLLTFADFPSGMVPMTNNDCERSLRHSVIIRKVTYCFRSHWVQRDLPTFVKFWIQKL